MLDPLPPLTLREYAELAAEVPGRALLLALLERAAEAQWDDLNIDPDARAKFARTPPCIAHSAAQLILLPYGLIIE